MQMKRASTFFLLAFLIFLQAQCFAQTQREKGKLLIAGSVYGYNHDPSRKFFKKEKPIVREGVLEAASVQAFVKDKLLNSVTTDAQGNFRIKLDTGLLYRLEFSKAGYSKSVLLIDLKTVRAENATSALFLGNAQLVLNRFPVKDTVEQNQPFGRLFYNQRKRTLDFEVLKTKGGGGLFSKTDPNSPVALLKKALAENKEQIANEERDEKLREEANKKISIDFALPPNPAVARITEKDVRKREAEIEQARRQLEIDRTKAITHEDSLIIQERTGQLDDALNELTSAKKIIDLQKDELSAQQKLLVVASGGVILLVAFLFFIYRTSLARRKINVLLEEKNRKITDSIMYAKYIQQSILPAESLVQKLLPESFIYHQARDIVSGDFYWISEIDSKIIVAAVDCTGHGVPGAFMSLIGSTLLNEIVNEKRIVQPSQILKQLHEGVLKSLNQNMGELNCQDGMEMSLCVIDRAAELITFAGAMNPIYIIDDDDITLVRPSAHAIGGLGTGLKKEITIAFAEQEIKIKKGMSLYMFTDGFMDQFGGPENIKLNTGRFKKMLLEMQKQEIKKQGLIVGETLKHWRGNQKQTDDILLIGIKF